MKEIKVLGAGCTRCVALADMIRQTADRLGVPVAVTKVTDMPTITGYGVMALPGVVVDEVVVHAGGMPKAEDIAMWLKG